MSTAWTICLTTCWMITPESQISIYFQISALNYVNDLKSPNVSKKPNMQSVLPYEELLYVIARENDLSAFLYRIFKYNISRGALCIAPILVLGTSC